ncbi:YSIRK signal domain/LPXTG anchor domain surface protein [Streptococcus suis]|uniref:YSIRK signal domain/LPXTG anchor domain surface protein n=1 Tax=Streptococcus suis TaxID=1307 RepID=UPI000421B05D|nr:YSIRK signal domain/LPXTG anchor domain surface protein [Streptococcus suis]
MKKSRSSSSRISKSLFRQQEVFSIRKLSLGVASVLLGSFFVGGSVVQAEEISGGAESSLVVGAEEKPPVASTEIVPVSEGDSVVAPDDHQVENSVAPQAVPASATVTPQDRPAEEVEAGPENVASVPTETAPLTSSSSLAPESDSQPRSLEKDGDASALSSAVPAATSSSEIVQPVVEGGQVLPRSASEVSGDERDELVGGESIGKTVAASTVSDVIGADGVAHSGSETESSVSFRSARSSSSYMERSVAHHVYDPEEAVKKQVQADITFVIDTTGSMSPYIEKVKNNLVELTSYLEKNDVNFGISVVTYKDSLEDGEDSTVIEKFSNNEYWAYDVDTVKEKLEELYVAGGGDDPETVAEGLIKVSDLQSVPTYLNRTHAKRFAFLLTDADYKQDKVSMEDVISKFKMSGIRTTVISQPEYEEAYRSLYTETQGEFIDINKESYSEVMSDFAKVIKESIDSDGDGLLDDWEEFGLKDEKGNVILDLPAMGANKHMKDLFVQVDWMHRTGFPVFVNLPLLGEVSFKVRELTTAPSSKALEMVRKQFLDHGIQLHIDMGPDSIMKYENGKAVTWGDLSAGGNRIQYKDVFEVGSNYKHWNQVVTDYLPQNRWNVFRHAFFVNTLSENGVDKGTGLASAIPGQAFIVAVKDIYDNNLAVAGTFMHELGHTLGLGHGGDDHTNGKPNHLSVMNYLFQLSGLVYSKTNFEHWVDFLFGEKEAYKRLNFSEYALPALDEKALREKDGIDPYHVITDKRLGTKIADANQNKAVAIHNVADGKDIDFNFNGRIDEGTVVANISRPEKNGDGKFYWEKYDKDLKQVDEETIMLPASVNEWERLVFKGGYIGGYGVNAYDVIETLIRKSSDEDDHSHDHENEEMTVKDYLELGLLANKGASYLSGIYPTYLEVGLNNQNLIVDIVNPHFESSIAKIEVQSSLVAETARVKTVTLEPSVSDLVTTSVKIPVVDDVKAGSYPVRVILFSEDGQVQVVDEELQVTENVSINLKVGESYSLPKLDDGFTWSIGNEGVVSLTADNRELQAKSVGQTTLALSLSGQVLEKYIVTVSTKPISVTPVITTRTRQEVRVLTTDQVLELEDSELVQGQTREEASINGQVVIEITETLTDGQVTARSERELSRTEAIPRKVYRGTMVVQVPAVAPTGSNLPTVKLTRVERPLTSEDIVYLEDATLPVGESREEPGQDGLLVVEVAEFILDNQVIETQEFEVSRTAATPRKIYRGAKEERKAATVEQKQAEPSPLTENVSVINQSLPNTGQTDSVYPAILGLSLFLAGTALIKSRKDEIV